MPTIQEFQNKAADCRESLRQLFELRRKAAKENVPKQNFDIEAGKKLYEETVENIGDILVFLHKEYGDRFSNCPLFSALQTPQHLKEFKLNFHKLFIDRISCLEVENPELQFNRYNLKGNTYGADLCYAESFAVAFYTMLVEVAEKMGFGARFDDEYRLPDDDLIEMFELFNLIATNHYAEEKQRCFGTFATYEKAQKRKEIQDKYGDNHLLYSFENCLSMLTMNENFCHDRAITSYYKDYLEQIDEADSDKAAVIYRFIDNISGAAHLCLDGNSRSAIILGWMLSILHNHDFTIACYANFADDSIIEAGKVWTKNFFRAPIIPAMSPEEKDLYKKAIKQNSVKTDVESICFSFLNHSFFASSKIDVFFEIPIDLTRVLFCGVSAQISSAFVVGSDFHQYQQAQEIELEGLMKVVEEHHQELISEPDITQKYAKLALYFMLDLEKSFKTKGVRLAAVNAIEHLCRAYPQEVFQGTNMEEDYRRISEIYNEIKEGRNPFDASEDEEKKIPAPRLGIDVVLAVAGNSDLEQQGK